jgi:ABC-type Mn2+/Zn2+ transport system permease subunit
MSALLASVDLLEPLTFGFFRRGLTVAVLAGALCGLIGVYVVLRSLSYIGHGLSHAVFGGAAAAAVMNVNYFLGAGTWGVASGLMIGRVTRRKLLSADAAIGIVTTASFAAGIVLFNKFGQARRSIDAVLFGDILGVAATDVYAVVGVGVLVLGVIVAAYRPLLYATFDSEVARVTGGHPDLLDAVLMVMLSLTVLVTMRVIGVLLISALLVLPASIARMLTDSFSRMLTLSPIIGAVTSLVGMNLSYHVNTSPGATVILINAAVFLVVFLATGRAGRRRVSHVHV